MRILHDFVDQAFAMFFAESYRSSFDDYLKIVNDIAYLLGKKAKKLGLARDELEKWLNDNFNWLFSHYWNEHGNLINKEEVEKKAKLGWEDTIF